MTAKVEVQTFEAVSIFLILMCLIFSIFFDCSFLKNRKRLRTMYVSNFTTFQNSPKNHNISFDIRFTVFVHWQLVLRCITPHHLHENDHLRYLRFGSLFHALPCAFSTYHGAFAAAVCVFNPLARSAGVFTILLLKFHKTV